MDINEESLRDMLGAVYGDGCAQVLLDRIAEGGRVTIRMNDGNQEILTNQAEALSFLRESFGWRPPGLE